MLQYNITEAQGGRVLVVAADDLQRYALHDADNKDLPFTRVGSKAVAIAHSPIKVYRKPATATIHKEYMQHNARSLWLGFIPNFDRLARNLYEYKQTI
jgi:hypothetical protein